MSETLEQFLETVEGTIKRNGPPVGPPVMFAGDRQQRVHVVLLADDPLVSARAAIDKIRPIKLVVVSVSTDNQWLNLHAEGTRPTQEMDRMYRLPGWQLVSTDVQHFTFSNLLGIRN